MQPVVLQESEACETPMTVSGGALQAAPAEVLPSLAELADRANREHSEVVRAGISMVQHAIMAGEALLAAKQQCDGSWIDWVDEHFDAHHSTATSYMRLATYKHVIYRDLANPTLVEAVKYLRGLPRADRDYDTSAGKALPAELKSEALRLHQRGVPNMEIARLLDVSYGTVYSWTHAEVWRRSQARRQAAKARRKAEREALRRQERERAMRKLGGRACTGRKTKSSRRWGSNDAQGAPSPQTRSYERKLCLNLWATGLLPRSMQSRHCAETWTRHTTECVRRCAN